MNNTTTKPLDLNTALQSFDRNSLKDELAQAEKERQTIINTFPLDQWPILPLERYALGFQESFCHWLEYKSKLLGSMKGDFADRKFIYKRQDGTWYFDKAYSNQDEAWEKVRSAFVELFEKAANNQFDGLDEIEPIRKGPMIRTKALYVYFPDKVLPIYSRTNLLYFLGLLKNIDPEKAKNKSTIDLNRFVLHAFQADPRFSGWSSWEIMRFLYQYFNPNFAEKIVKVTPGDDAKYWPECRDNGYICVGWDELGDLSEFNNDWDTYLKRFNELYLQTLYKGNEGLAKKKAGEPWTLAHLKPGDIVIAFKGQTQVLGVGRVTEEAYEWHPERTECKHTVHVKWDTSIQGTIALQKAWGFVSVATANPEQYRLILELQPSTPGGGDKPLPEIIDPIFREIGDALERKGQVIMYGPPGTGKTYSARRFALWWLSGQDKPGSVPAQATDISKIEEQLTTVQVTRRAWWIVANPKEWSWDRLFKDGVVEYRYGRLQRNYPLVQPGDLVFGYQSNPDKKLMALAKISRGFGLSKAGTPSIELVPFYKLTQPLSYDEMKADPTLSNTEPMRFNNQGTLFALTPDEADYLLAQLEAKNPGLSDILNPPAVAAGSNGATPPAANPILGLDTDEINQLTFLTFHPSYTYEDFIEGFKPVPSAATGGGLNLRLEDGVFKRICRQAQANPGKRYLVLIDEINRANLAKVFGELITLLEKDKRGKFKVVLPQSRETFTIPENVYLLGTMNTADKSIKLLDAALRRRFAFKELMPDADLLTGGKIGDLLLDVFLEELNRRIATREGREKQIGHSFLLEDGKAVDEPEEFARRFRQEILPLLQEYCYDDYADLAYYLGDKLVDKQAQTLDFDILNDPDKLVEALAFSFKGTSPT